jgi:hypothetical protein
MLGGMIGGMVWGMVVSVALYRAYTRYSSPRSMKRFAFHDTGMPESNK